MASSLISPFKYFYVILFIFTISVLLSRTVKCAEFEVGGDNGWATPNQQFYDDWASNNRFQVNDTLRFAYKKDSVMVVTEEEYEKCRSSHPMFFSNNGDTTFRLDRPGLFYFISGVSGHCTRGLKMVIKVLNPESPPKAAAHHKSASATTSIHMAVFVFVPSLAGVMFV